MFMYARFIGVLSASVVIFVVPCQSKTRGCGAGSVKMSYIFALHEVVGREMAGSRVWRERLLFCCCALRIEKSKFRWTSAFFELSDHAARRRNHGALHLAGFDPLGDPRDRQRAGRRPGRRHLRRDRRERRQERHRQVLRALVRSHARIWFSDRSSRTRALSKTNVAAPL